MELPNKYDPAEIENKWQLFWEENKTFAFDPENTEKTIFSIDTPPPTVSGKMHLGHAFGNSQQDFIARFKRMQGFNVLQPFGTDDNGLPTKLLVEKLKKVSASKMDRKEFRQLCLDTLDNELKPSYINDWKRLGISCDFDVSYSTIDPHAQKVSQKSFLDLYKAGREYRTEAPAMFCPKCQTAISQVECEDVELDSHFNDIVFTSEGEEIIVATTRPELLPACVSVFYNPKDTRYQHLKGKMAKVPIFDFEVPIMEDDKADPEKGTGLVMCCTFGDQNDMEWQKKHKLPIKEAINKYGKLTDLAGKYSGQKIKDARVHILHDMNEAGLLKKQEAIKHAVNVHERCGTPIEFIHSKQWFIKYLDLKEDMMKWGDAFTWHPKHMKNRYDNWVNGLAWDWCISRQLPFGIPFPVWYCADCDEVILAKEEDLPVDPMIDKAPVDACPKCGKTEFIPEKDIINTWATSSLTPTIVIELFKDKPVYETLKNNPMDIRPMGHDIISFWLFNTVVKSHLHYDMSPWKNAFINGWMLDPHGKKMSKSKGNVVEPQTIIDKYSADALRFMAASATLGEDLPFPEKDVVAGKKTVTKIFNASKFVHMHLEDYDINTDIAGTNLQAIDKWMLEKLNETIKEATEHFEKFHFFKAKAAIDRFFWKVLCDNYLEIVKDRLYQPEVHGDDLRLSAQATLYHTLFGVLRLYSPFVPFVTEEVYSWMYKDHVGTESVHVTAWPTVDDRFNFESESKAGDLAINVIGAVRKVKSQEHVSQKHEVLKLIVPCTGEEKTLLETVVDAIKRTVSAKEIVLTGNTSDAMLEDVHVETELAPREEKKD